MTLSAIERFPHRAFSPRRLAAIAGDTLTELTRLKAFYVLLLFALTLIGGSVVMARLSFQQEFQILKDISLGTMSFFTSLLAIVASARMLPHEIENRTIYAVLAKPVPRFEYLAGKLLGVFLLLAISVAVMGALFLGVLYLREQSVLAETTRQMSGLPAEQVAEALRAIRATALNSNLLPAIAIILVKAAVIAAFTFFLSTFATSSIFTVLMAVFVYFIGHLQATAREFWLQEQGGSWLSRIFLAIVALVFPDLQQFTLADEIVAGSAIPMTLFLKTMALGGFYILLYLLLSAAVFAEKEL